MTPDRLVASLALVVAVCALGVSAWAIRDGDDRGGTAFSKADVERLALESVYARASSEEPRAVLCTDAEHKSNGVWLVTCTGEIWVTRTVEGNVPGNFSNKTLKDRDFVDLVRIDDKTGAVIE